MLENELPSVKKYFVLLKTTEGELLKLDYGQTVPTQENLDSNMANIRPGQGIAVCEIYEAVWRRVS